MLVGITYDLKDEYLAEGYSQEETAEFDKEETICGIENALNDAGFETERIGHAKNLIKLINERRKWDIVFNIAEGMYGIAREAQVPCILDVFNIPYVFSDGLTLSLTLHKGLTKHIIRDAGIKTADFVIIQDIGELKSVSLPYPLFAKPVAEGTGKGISISSVINSPEQLFNVCAGLLKQFNQPVLIETYLPGREFTVGISGTGKDSESLGVIEISYNKNEGAGIYGLNNKENYEQFVNYFVPEEKIITECSELALKCWKILCCRDAGRIDIRYDNNNVPNFLEVNPLAGLNFKHSDLPILCGLNGISFNELIKKIMNSAIKRIRAKL